MSVSELAKIISPAFTEETIFKILSTKSGLSDLTILDLAINNDKSQKGDSYLSSICRLKLRASGKNSSGELQEFNVPVIVKYFPKNIARRKTFRSVDFFKTEIYFYEKVWPEMKNLMQSKIPNEPDVLPLLLASHCDGKNDFIAFEDLGPSGYVPSGRMEVVTKKNLYVYLGVLAKVHALALVLKKEKPEFEKLALNIPESYFADEYRSWYENWLYKSMGPRYQQAAKELLPPEYYDKIIKFFSTDFFGEVIKGCNINNKFATVTEGDAWLPNFLAKNDNDGNKIDPVLIDFQLARFAPLVNDLLHFLYSCVPEQMLLEGWDDFLAEYHRCLSNRIQELGGDKTFITLQELYEEIKQHGLVGVAMAMESVVMSLLTDDEVANIDQLQGDNAIPLEDVWILPQFDRARNEKMAFLVKHMIDKGIIS